MAFIDWYNALRKPSWTPAPATIGLIWQILYPILFASIAVVVVQAFRRRIPWRTTLPFAVNLAANLVFTPIQFGLRNLPLASIDILIVWGSILWMAYSVRKSLPWVAVAQIPYFIWVSTATVLQLSITWMNR
jgi:tryptophan-rich sensory protein